MDSELSRSFKALSLENQLLFGFLFHEHLQIGFGHSWNDVVTLRLSKNFVNDVVALNR